MTVAHRADTDQNKRLNAYRVFAVKRKARKRRKKAKPIKKPRPTIVRWAKIRADIIERDHGACRICGDQDRLHVHHIDSDRSNNKGTNLVTLCEPCHRAVHLEGYKPWEHDVPAPWGELE